MNKIELLLFFMLSCLTINSQAQNICTSQRYTASTFNVEITSEPAIYATAPALWPLYLIESFTFDQELSFDLYEPQGDVLTKRPLIIMAFGGAFLVGSKDQAELVDYCTEMASRGFVVAAIDYRLGFNALSGNSAIRAVYRGAQDFKAAVRYFRENAAMYGIDPNRVFGSGNSAGSISAIHAAYLEESERAASPILAPTYNNPDLGCLDCSGNSIVQNSAPNAVVNLWGAIGLTDWIESDEAPIISFHGTDDTVVNPNTAAPFGADALFPAMSGSISIHDHAMSIGLQSELHIYQGEGHELWGNAAIATDIKTLSADFLYRQLQPDLPIVSGPASACVAQTTTYCIDTPEPTSTYCWNVTGGTIAVDNGACITVDWTISEAFGMIEVSETNCVDAVSEVAMVSTYIDVPPTALFSFVYNDNVVDFTNLSTNATDYTWDFGDGTTSTDANPSHLFDTNGTYNVTLIASNGSGCSQSVSLIITQNCQPNMTIAASPTPSGLYQAANWVLSNMLLEMGANATFKAADCIRLEAGFEVPLGTEFLGVTEPCVN